MIMKARSRLVRREIRRKKNVSSQSSQDGHRSIRRLFAIMRTWRVRSCIIRTERGVGYIFTAPVEVLWSGGVAPQGRRQVSDVAEFPVSEIIAQRGFSTFDREKYWRAVMLNLSNLSKLDLSAIDIRTTTSAEREAVIREAMRRARDEGAAVMRDLINGSGSCWARSQAAARQRGPGR
jgi:hypothetical protein